MPMTQGTVPGADLGPQTGLSQQAAPGQPGGQVPTGEAMQALAVAAMQATQSASQAVLQMHALQERQASDRKFTGYSDASKVLKGLAVMIVMNQTLQNGRSFTIPLSLGCCMLRLSTVVNLTP